MFFKSNKIPQSPPDFDKGAFPDYIKKEIFMQPDLIDAFVKKHIKGGRIDFSCLKIKTDKIKYIYVVGTAESYCAALFAAYNFEALLDVPASARLISEFECGNPVLDKYSLVITICKDSSACERVRVMAKTASAQFVGIFDFSPEDKKSVSLDYSGKTKAEICEVTLRLTAVIMLALYLGGKNQCVEKQSLDLAEEKLLSVSSKLKKVLQREYDFRELGELLKDKKLSFSGSNVDYAVSLYAAYLFAEFKGEFLTACPLGAYDNLFERENISVFIASNSDFYSLGKNKNFSLVFAPESCQSNKNVFPFEESIPLLNPVIMIVCIQFLIYSLGDSKLYK